MRREDACARALGAVGHRIGYRLGSNPPNRAELPQDVSGCSDCSGFVSWVFGYRDFWPEFAWLRRINGGWMNTDGIVADTREKTGIFEPVLIEQRQVGDLVVYPSHSVAVAVKLRDALSFDGPDIGHVGIITRIVGDGYLVTHCSSGNWRRTGDAIQETTPDVFEKVPYRIFARFAGIE